MNLHSLTLPGLDVPSDWRAVHDRLLDDFPAIDDVIPTTMVATLLIAYSGPAEVDAWLGAIGEALLGRRLGSARHPAGPTATAVRLELRCVGGASYPQMHGTTTPEGTPAGAA